MSRSNPLFVDSTKLSSDSLGCTVELKGLRVENGESVYVKVIDSRGSEESSELRQTMYGSYSNKVWLQHQQEVVVQFYVMGSGGVVRSSKEYPAKATYAMEFDWVEVIKNEGELKASLSKQKPVPTQDQVMADFVELSSLIDKWGL